jgi:hypothetical protein
MGDWLLKAAKVARPEAIMKAADCSVEYIVHSTIWVQLDQVLRYEMTMRPESPLARDGLVELSTVSFPRPVSVCAASLRLSRAASIEFIIRIAGGLARPQLRP